MDEEKKIIDQTGQTEQPVQIEQAEQTVQTGQTVQTEQTGQTVQTEQAGQAVQAVQTGGFFGKLRGRARKLVLRLFLVLILLGILGVMTVLGLSSLVERSTTDDILYAVLDKGPVQINAVSLADLKDFDADCILILGAGIKDEETPSDMLRDRLDTGIALYQAGVAPKLLLSGDNGQQGYNEIHVMLNYVLQAGVPREDAFCDHAGFSTYDSMYRAGSIFEAERVIVVTQTYHQYRALYVGKKLGLSVAGVASDQQRYRGAAYRELREKLARCKDLFKAFFRPSPTYGGQAIPISGSALLSQDE